VVGVTLLTPARLEELLGSWRPGGPAAEQLAGTIRALVLDGRIPVAARLPPERALAQRLNLSRATVSTAYERLRSDRYLASRQGSGSWVTLPAGHEQASDAVARPGEIDLRIAALPAPPMLAQLAADAAAELPRWLDHHGYEPLGLPPLRAAVAARFAARGLPTRPDQVMITGGALQALDLTVRTLLPRGGSALVELPGYPAAIEAIAAHGARLHRVPVDGGAWDLAALDAVAARQRPAVAYLTPDFHNPTGALLDERGRAAAGAALYRAGVHLIVDETFVELNLDEPAMPLPAAGWGGPGAVTLGSLSKAVWGGLRIGWIRADRELIQRIATTRAHVDMAGPVLEQLLATLVMERLDEIVAERHALASERRAQLLAAIRRDLPEWRVDPARGGLFVWAQLPAPISTSLSVLAREYGVAVSPGPRFGSTGLLERRMRLPFTARPEELERAVGVLAAVAPRATGARAGAPDRQYVA
jgi:DNA-binding transcriptional MocR family regulator